MHLKLNTISSFAYLTIEYKIMFYLNKSFNWHIEKVGIHNCAAWWKYSLMEVFIDMQEKKYHPKKKTENKEYPNENQKTKNIWKKIRKQRISERKFRKQKMFERK